MRPAKSRGRSVQSCSYTGATVEFASVTPTGTIRTRPADLYYKNPIPAPLARERLFGERSSAQYVAPGGRWSKTGDFLSLNRPKVARSSQEKIPVRGALKSGAKLPSASRAG